MDMDNKTQTQEQWKSPTREMHNQNTLNSTKTIQDPAALQLHSNQMPRADYVSNSYRDSLVSQQRQVNNQDPNTIFHNKVVNDFSQNSQNKRLSSSQKLDSSQFLIHQMNDEQQHQVREFDDDSLQKSRDFDRQELNSYNSKLTHQGQLIIHEKVQRQMLLSNNNEKDSLDASGKIDNISSKFNQNTMIQYQMESDEDQMQQDDDDENNYWQHHLHLQQQQNTVESLEEEERTKYLEDYHIERTKDRNQNSAKFKRVGVLTHKQQQQQQQQLLQQQQDELFTKSQNQDNRGPPPPMGQNNHSSSQGSSQLQSYLMRNFDSNTSSANQIQSLTQLQQQSSLRASLPEKTQDSTLNLVQEEEEGENFVSPSRVNQMSQEDLRLNLSDEYQGHQQHQLRIIGRQTPQVIDSERSKLTEESCSPLESQRENMKLYYNDEEQKVVGQQTKGQQYQEQQQQQPKQQFQEAFVLSFKGKEGRNQNMSQMNDNDEKYDIPNSSSNLLQLQNQVSFQTPTAFKGYKEDEDENDIDDEYLVDGYKDKNTQIQPLNFNRGQPSASPLISERRGGSALGYEGVLATASAPSLVSNSSDRFQGSFYQRYEKEQEEKSSNLKLRDFEKSTLIRFEEFKGLSSSNDEDSYRDQQDNIHNQQQQITHQSGPLASGPAAHERQLDLQTNWNERPSQQLSQKYGQQQRLMNMQENDLQEISASENAIEARNDEESPLNNEKQYPLFIITEEDNSEIQSSSFHTFNRMMSANSSQMQIEGSQGTYQARQRRKHQNNSGAPSYQQLQFGSQEYSNSSDQNQNLILYNKSTSQSQGNSQDFTNQYHKSKSQPLKPPKHTRGSMRFSQGQNQNADIQQEQIIHTDTSPLMNKNLQISPRFQDTDEYYEDQPYHHFSSQQARLHTESPLQQVKASSQDGHSQSKIQMIQRVQKYPGQKPSMNSATNVSQPDFIMSDEDLLSNIDRVSKIMPMNDISEDDIDQKGIQGNTFNASQILNNTPNQTQHQLIFHNGFEESGPYTIQSLIQKLNEQKQIIDHLRYESKNHLHLVQIKDSQLSLMQHKNDQLEERIKELEQIVSSHPDSLMRAFGSRVQADASTQVQNEELFSAPNSEKKKISKTRKSKQSFSQLKKTPMRQNMNDDQASSMMHLSSDPNLMLYQMGNNFSQLNQQHNVFDTPQIKLDNFLLKNESPVSNYPKNTLAMSKHYSMSVNSDDQFNHVKQQMVQLKQQLQRSEENTLSLQHKIEKQKNDKQIYKKKIVDITTEKNEFKIRMESLIRDYQENERKWEALKIDVQEYKKTIEKLESQIHQKKSMMTRSVSAKELPLTFEQGVQTDSTQFNFQPNQTRKYQSPIVQASIQDQIMSGMGQLDDLGHQEVGVEAQNCISSHYSSSKSFISAPQINQLQSFNQAVPNMVNLARSSMNVGVLLDKEREYELISQQLEREINQYRQLQKEHAQKAMLAKSHQHEIEQLTLMMNSQLTLKEEKIIRLKEANKRIEKESIEFRIKYEEAEKNLVEMKSKVDSKIQEKDFKIMTLKNQFKILKYQGFNFGNQISGVPTPPLTQPSQNLLQNGLKVNEDDIYQLVSTIVRQQLQRHPLVSNSGSLQENAKARAKSHEQTNKRSFNERQHNFYEEGLLHEDQRAITTQPSRNVFYGQDENASFSQIRQENLNFYSPEYSRSQIQSHSLLDGQIVRPHSKNIQNYQERNETFDTQQNYYHERGLTTDSNHEFITQIFNSSLRRIREINPSYGFQNQHSNSNFKPQNQMVMIDSLNQSRNFSQSRSQHPRNQVLNPSSSHLIKTNHQNPIELQAQSLRRQDYKSYRSTHKNKSQPYAQSRHLVENHIYNQGVENSHYQYLIKSRDPSPIPVQNDNSAVGKVHASHLHFLDDSLQTNVIGPNIDQADKDWNHIMSSHSQFKNQQEQKIINSGDYRDSQITNFLVDEDQGTIDKIQQKYRQINNQQSSNLNRQTATQRHPKIDNQSFYKEISNIDNRSFLLVQNPPQIQDLNEINLFDNTQNNFDREQNASFFLDFKPAFENSTYTNNNQSLKMQPPLKKSKQADDSAKNHYESIRQSLSNSFRHSESQQRYNQGHIRLPSNLVREDQDLNHTLEQVSCSNPSSHTHQSIVDSHKLGNTQSLKSVTEDARVKPAFQSKNGVNFQIDSKFSSFATPSNQINIENFRDYQPNPQTRYSDRNATRKHSNIICKSHQLKQNRDRDIQQNRTFLLGVRNYQREQQAEYIGNSDQKIVSQSVLQEQDYSNLKVQSENLSQDIIKRVRENSSSAVRLNKSINQNVRDTNLGMIQMKWNNSNQQSQNASNYHKDLMENSKSLQEDGKIQEESKLHLHRRNDQQSEIIISKKPQFQSNNVRDGRKIDQSTTERKQFKPKILKQDLHIASGQLRYDDFIQASSKLMYPSTSQASNSVNVRLQDLSNKQSNYRNHTSPNNMESLTRVVQNIKSFSNANDGSKSTLSNYSQKLEDIRRKYGRIN